MRRLLHWLLPDDDRRAFESEEAELYEARRAADGVVSAVCHRSADRLRLIVRLAASRKERRPTDDHSASRGGGMVGPLVRDVRQSLRGLRRSPGLAVTIVLTVGLGIGATSAILTVIQAVVLNPLPYRHADRLVLIRTADGDNLFSLSVVDYNALANQQTVFTAVGASQAAVVTVVRAGVVERPRAKTVTASYFTVLGLTPMAGRLFTADDEHAKLGAVVLSAGYWRTRFGADPNVIGSTLLLDGAPYTVVGVLAPSEGPLEQDIALYRVARWPTPTRKGPFSLTVIAALGPTVSRQAASDELTAINRRILPIWMSSYQNTRATWVMTDLKTRVIGTASEPLGLVGAGVLGVLLIACVNAASLLVARALERRRELAVRVALGASRAQIVRVLAAESVILVTGAVVVAVALATGALRAVALFGTGYIPRLGEVHLAGPAFLWLAAFSLVSLVLIGVLPAWGGSRLRLEAGADTTARTVSEGPGRRRLRRLLVASEFAVATPLLIAAGLVTLSLQHLRHVDVGIDGSHVTTASVALPLAQYSPAAAHAFWDRARASLLAEPGVAGVAFADSRPPADLYNINNFDLADRPTPPNGSQPVAPWIAVTREFFDTTGLRLVRGRLFETPDYSPSASPVIVVDRAWAHRFFGADEVIGRRLQEGGCKACPPTTVVGEVETVKYLGLEAPDEGTVYQPMDDGWLLRYLVVRTRGPAMGLAPVLVRTVHALDPNLAVTQIATIDELVDASIEVPRYLSLLVGAFALSALLLSVVGVYGVMAHFVTRHARDIGIRLALGGAPPRIGAMVIRQGLEVAAVGILAGLAGAPFLTRLMASQLFGVTPTDGATFLAVPAVMALVAAVACAWPAWRASKLQPAAILHDS